MAHEVERPDTCYNWGERGEKEGGKRQTIKRLGMLRILRLEGKPGGLLQQPLAVLYLFGGGPFTLMVASRASLPRSRFSADFAAAFARASS